MEKVELFITEEELLENSSKLTFAVNQLKIIGRVLENIEYARVSGDDIAKHYQINTGVLGIVNDGLTDLREMVMDVSNNICPD